MTTRSARIQAGGGRFARPAGGSRLQRLRRIVAFVAVGGMITGASSRLTAQRDVVCAEAAARGWWLASEHSPEGPEAADDVTACAEEQGDASAQAFLGLMYARGWIVTRDDAEAVRWYRLAAEQGDAGAQYGLGTMYLVEADDTAHLGPSLGPRPARSARTFTPSRHRHGGLVVPVVRLGVRARRVAP